MNHVDPELLAAWADGALASEESRAVESHLADCAECRAVAAVFGRTMELDAASESRAESRMPLSARGTVAVPPHSLEGHTALGAAGLRWILPIAATIVIAAGITWKYWPRPMAPVEMAAVAPAQPVAPPPVMDTMPTAPAPAPANLAPPAKAPQTKVTEAPKPVERAQPVTKSVAPAPLPPAPAPQLTPPPVQVAVPPPPPAMVVASPPPPPVTSAVTVTAAPPVVTADLGTRASVAVQGAQTVGVAGGRGGGGGGRAVTIASTPPLRWRVTPGNIVQRSADEGATWTTVPFDGIGVQLVSGSAPTPNVCWLIGRLGAVFVSKDAGAFKRVPFPETVDLVSVIAIDELHATVIAADGRSFVTDDGGQTWRIARF